MDAVRRKIDESLATDDQLRRQHGMMEFRSPYRFPNPTEMENSMPPTWIQWISREANKLCNEITQMIDQETNEILSEFRPILEDVELEGEYQPDLMGFKTPQPGNEVEVWGEEGNSPQQGLYEHQNEPQSENSNTTQINIWQTTANSTQRIEENSENPRSQQNEVVSENTQQQNGQVSQNHTDENTRITTGNNTENMTNINSNNNHHSTASNNMSVLQVPVERSENSQNYFRVDTQLNINTPHYTAP